MSPRKYVKRNKVDLGETLYGPDQGLELVRLERMRQRLVEGHHPAIDAEYVNGELSAAAACYALVPSRWRDILWQQVWPWPSVAFKPRGRKENLIRAGALIVAELDRLIAAERRGQLRPEETSP